MECSVGSDGKDLIKIEQDPLKKDKEKHYTLRSLKEFNREERYQYSTTIKCEKIRKGADSNPSEFTNIELLILDVPDEPPRFSQNLYEFQVTENQDIASIISVLTATDEDSEPENRQMKYSLVQSNDANCFSIDANSGVLNPKVSFDRELKDSYTFEAKVSDPLNSTMSSIATIVIKILGTDFHFSLFICHLSLKLLSNKIYI